jgi:hypothetical protein
MELFKKSKHQPIKFRNFKFVGHHKDYANACYYVKELPRDNFEIMECMLEWTSKHPEVGAGTKVQIIDTFMSNYLYNNQNNIKTKDTADFIKYVVEHSFSELTDKQKEGMIKKFNSVVPKEVKESKTYKDCKKEGFNLLYCSNDESEERKMAIVNIVMVKEQRVISKEMGIDRTYTIFKPFKYRVLPSYLNKTSKEKYMEEIITPIMVSHDILN